MNNRLEDSQLRIAGKLYLAISALFCVLVAAFSMRSLGMRICCDAASYLALGQEILDKGALSKLSLSDLRTIGYPSFLAAVLWLPLALDIRIKVAVAQAVVYWISVALLVRTSRRAFQTSTQQKALAVGLLVNPLAAMYCTEVLSESLSLSLTIAIAATTCALTSTPPDRRQRHALCFLLGALAGLALLVRPANLALVIAVMAAMVAPPWFVQAMPRWSLRQRFGASASRAIAATLGLYVAVSPQIASNLMHFDRATPMPTYPLGAMQTRVGLANLKFGALVQFSPPQPVLYENPFVRGAVVPASPLRFYLENPGRGLMTIGGHVLATLVQDPFFVYVTDLDPWHRVPIILLNAIILVFGGGFFVRTLWRHRWVTVGSPTVWLLASWMAASLAIVALATPESRFGLGVLSVCFVAFVLAVAEHMARRQLPRLGPMLIGAVGSSVFVWLALGLRHLARIK